MRLRFAMILVGTILLGAGCGSSGEAEEAVPGGTGGESEGGGGAGDDANPGSGGFGASDGAGGHGASDGDPGDGAGGSGADPGGGAGGGHGGTGGDPGGGTGGSGGTGGDPGGGAGGQGGSSNGGGGACRVLEKLVSSALAEAQSCESSPSCEVFVPGMCCPEVVSSTNPTAIATYTGRLHAYFMACGAPDCAGVVCASSGTAICGEGGRCEHGQ